jgi:alkylation response protein AidB-like acyl-CoA dehydrogenase
MVDAGDAIADGWAVRRRADDLSQDVLLPDEVRGVRGEARAFADEVLRPQAHALNSTPETRDGFRRDIFDAIAGAGLFGVPFAKTYGGRGLAFPTLATLTVVEELAYYSAGVASAMFDAQAILFGKTLESEGGPLAAAYLPRLVRGEFVAAFATSEPGASTDLSPASVRTVATEVPGGYRISGVKRWITNAVAAQHIILLCRTGEGLSLLLADMRLPEIRVSDPDIKMGNKPQLTADIHFADAFVPADHVIGAVGAGLRSAFSALTLGRMGISAVGVGLAQRAFDVATHYASRRQVYGRPIAANQYWQYAFAAHALRLEQARSLYQKAGAAQDTGQDASILAAMAKLDGSALAVDLARDAIQVCGGYGFVRELGATGEQWPLEAIYRDAKIGEIYEGANEVQKWIIARRIFGRRVTG